MVGNVCSDVIYRCGNYCAVHLISVSERRGQSQKPEQVYEIIEQLVPNGNYLEIFARRNNLRNYWLSIGLEL
jgi:mRNA (2'-O-methyladenosine-N6-)-methyltransferase